MPSWRSIICAPILAGVRYAHAASIRTARASTLSFAPVTVTTDAPASQPGPVDPPDPSRNSQVEIALPNGRRLIVTPGVDSEALARILSVVDEQ